MKTIMRTGQLSENVVKQAISDRNSRADRLIEKWSKKKDLVGDGFQEKAHSSLNKYRNLSIMLENLEDHLATLTETQIATSFGTTPRQLIKIIRLGYPNSAREDVFHVWGMETMRDDIYINNIVYNSTKRDATAETIYHESAANRYASSISVDVVDGTGSGTNYTGTLAKVPLYPFKLTILVGGIPVAVDNGSGVFVGATMSKITASTINYTTGEYDITFSGAPGLAITIESVFVTEGAYNTSEMGDAELRFTPVQFNADFYPLGVSWSLHSEFLLKSTLNTDTEEVFNVGCAELLRKELDFRTFKMAYRSALGNTVINFNADWKSGGADSAIAHAQSISNALERGRMAIYKDLQRGGISNIFGGPDAVAYLTYHKDWVYETAVAQVGVYKMGSIRGIPVYVTPTDIVPNDELVLNWKNPADEYDSSVSVGVFLPVAQFTPKLTYKNLYSEKSLYSVEDKKVLNSKYLRRIKLLNLPTE